MQKCQKWSSKDSFTFDIGAGYMVSGEKELYLWGGKILHDQGESQRESDGLEEEPKQNKKEEQMI